MKIEFEKSDRLEKINKKIHEILRTRERETLF
jgi:hypothetical protein